MSYKNKKKASVSCVFLSCILIAVCFLTACQSTPEQEAVTQKDGALEEASKKTASPMEQATKQDELEEKWMFEKEYESGHRLIVDAVITNMDISNIPVMSVCEKPFEDGEQIRQIIEVFCPDSKIYEHVGATKSGIEEEILEYEKMLHQIRNGDDSIAVPLAEKHKSLPVEELEVLSSEEALVAFIEELKEKYEDALDESDLEEASLEFRDVPESVQCNVQAIEKDRTVYFDIINWNTPGSDFYMRESKYENDEIIESFVDPLSLSDDTVFSEEKEMIDGIVRDMGIDYMSLDSLSKGKRGYTYYYTRSENELQETYADNFVGSVQIDSDGMIMMDLFKAESLEIETQDGRIVKAHWENPTEVIKEDNDNVKVLPWEEIEEVFKTQMDYMLMPEPLSNVDDVNAMVFPKATEIHISKIELGLMKVLMKDSGSDYKLIPVWSFMGYDTSFVQEGVQPGADVCFLTINALDGSVMNRGLMY